MSLKRGGLVSVLTYLVFLLICVCACAVDCSRVSAAEENGELSTSHIEMPCIEELCIEKFPDQVSFF